MFLRLGQWFGPRQCLGVSPDVVDDWPVLVVVESIAATEPDNVIGSVASNPVALDILAPSRVVPVVTVAVVVSGRSGVVVVFVVVADVVVVVGRKVPDEDASSDRLCGWWCWWWCWRRGTSRVAAQCVHKSASPFGRTIENQSPPTNPHHS